MNVTLNRRNINRHDRDVALCPMMERRFICARSIRREFLCAVNRFFAHWRVKHRKYSLALVLCRAATTLEVVTSATFFFNEGNAVT